MIRYFLLLVAAAASLSGFAQLSGPGYYRVKNLHRGRYVYVCDNQSDGANFAQSTADLSAIRLRKGHETTVSDPAAVIYVAERSSGSRYDLQAQGTGVYAMISHYAKIARVSDNCYNVYATVSGLTKYLSDNDDTEDEYGIMGLDGKQARRQWSVAPIDASTDEYFGLTPGVSVGGRHYKSFYAEFPFSFASSGMRAFYVKAVDTKLGVAIVADWPGDVVSGATPVIVECASDDPSGNRLNLLRGTYAQPSDNQLVGVYFNYPYKRKKSADAVTVNDKATMRVLSTLSDGSLGFVMSTASYMTANEAYLRVPSGAPAQLRIMTEAEYEAAAISTVSADVAPDLVGIYSPTGVRLSSDPADLDRLPKGIYIVNGRKVVRQ